MSTFLPDFRRLVRPFFLTPSNPPRPTRYKPIYDALSYLTTQLAFCFTTAPFVLLSLPDSLLVWTRVYFYCILGVAASLAFFSSPAKKMLLQKLDARAKAAGATGREGLHRTASETSLPKHPSHGISDDPEGDIQEAVKEIRAEIELRRRRGSKVEVPRGPDLIKAVEGKLGRKLR